MAANSGGTVDYSTTGAPNRIAQAVVLVDANGAPINGGSGVLGSVAVDQTTPGTTNAVSSLGTGINVATTSTAIGSTAIDVQVVAATTSLRLCGFSFRENAGSTASLVIRNGTGTGDTPLAYVTLAPNESVRDWFGDAGKIAAAGVYLDMISGTVIGQIDTKVVA